MTCDTVVLAGHAYSYRTTGYEQSSLVRAAAKGLTQDILDEILKDT